MAHTSAKKGINKVSGVPMIDMDVLVKEEVRCAVDNSAASHYFCLVLVEPSFGRLI